MAFEYQIDRNGATIHMTLRGEMRLEGAEQVIARFEDLLPSGSFEFHAHMTELAKYDAASREAWTRVLRKHRTRCTKIVIYGARPLVRMAAATVAMIVRLPIDFCDEPG